MSYSFSVRAASKEAVLEKVHAELEKIVQQQPVHAVDKAAAFDVASAFVELLPADEGKDVHVSVNGSVYEPSDGLQSASVSVSVQRVNKE